ncbi:MAG: hypothetical protein IPP64_01910 [Bacteroidetes bacterium]|nr:hypothetical protein [Bacteroidota bacterium]
MINKNHIVFCIGFLLLLPISLFSQQWNYSLSRDFLWGIDNYYNNKEENTSTFVKPYRLQEIKKIKDSSAVFPRLLAGTKAEEKDKKANAQIEVYPLLSAKGGYDLSPNSHATSDFGIGATLLAFYKDKVALCFQGYGSRGVYTSFMDSITRESRVIPGMGYAYVSKNDSLHPQYAMQYFAGYISYSPNKIFNFQAGRDKHFWGDGYRSLFLSDVAAPYPYLKITTNVWKLSYVNLFTIMKDATNPSGFKKDWLTKYATFHHLSWNATKRINIGLFESIVWQGSDSTRHRGYDVNYLNPIMFFRPTEYSLGSSDNAFVGLDFKIKAFKKQQFYGQLLLDEFLLKEVVADLKHAIRKDTTAKWGWWANKQAFQIGFKSFDLFRIKNLNFQTEFNYVRPFTYSHGSVQQNYGHMNQPLAHPLGANFMESVTFLNYRFKRLFIEAKLMYAVYGDDSPGSDFGKNIFISYVNRAGDYNHYTTQGFRTNLMTTSLRGAYILDTRMNLKIELGVANRIIQTASVSKQNPYVFIGIKTDLGNMYDDY